MRHIDNNFDVKKLPELSREAHLALDYATIKRVADANPDGFTLNLVDFRYVKDGFAVAYEATQDSTDAGSIAKVYEHAQENGRVIGGWLDNGKYYYDSVKVFTKEEDARAFAIKNNQIAYFDLTNKKEIRLR